jgi:oligopeptide transport system substrate-binding protein
MSRLALALLLTLTATACTGGSTPRPEVPPPQALRFVNGPEPRYIDPALLTDSFGGFIAANLFEGLVLWDAAAEVFEPGVAESWKVSQDGLTWRFTLRNNARWSNGDPVSAKDFVESWLRVLNPSTGSDYASLLYPIVGARSLHLGESRDPSSLGVEAESNQQLVVHLESPNPQFLSLLAQAVYLPVSGRALKRSGWEWTRPENIVTNGPFTLSTWVPKDRFVLTKNPYYWDAKSVRLERVVAHSTDDADRLLQLWKDGKLDWSGPATGAILGDRLTEARSLPGFQQTPFLATWCLIFNLRDGVFENSELRKAVALAIDRNSVVQALDGSGTPAYSLVPPGIAGYDPPRSLLHDPEQAAELWREHKGPEKLELAVDQRSQSLLVAAELGRQLTAALGIEVDVYPREWRVHNDVLDKGDFQLARWAWAGDYPSPNSFLEPFLSDSGLNTANYNNIGFDRLLDTASRSPDKRQQFGALRSAEEVLLSDLPVLPVFHLTAAQMVSPRVTGFVSNILDLHLLKYMSLQAQTPAR